MSETLQNPNLEVDIMLAGCPNSSSFVLFHLFSPLDGRPFTGRYHSAASLFYSIRANDRNFSREKSPTG